MRTETRGGRYRIIALSAHTPGALTVARERLARHLSVPPRPGLDDVSTTLTIGREPLPERWAVVARDVDAAVAALRGDPADENLSSVVTGEGRAEPGIPPRVVFGFSRGWSHGLAVRYGSAYRSFEEFRRWLERAAELLDDHLPLPLLTWLDQQDDRPALTDAIIAAPAAFAVDFALARQLAAWGAVPAEAFGHGAGQFTADAAMGEIEFDDALLRVANWGRMVTEGSVEPEPEDSGPFDQIPSAVKEGAMVLTIGPSLALTRFFDTYSSSGVTVQKSGSESDQALLTILVQLWCHGAEVDLTTGLPGRRIHLPAYPFQRPSLPMESMEKSAGAKAGTTARPLTALEQRLIFLDLVRRSSNIEHNVMAVVEITGSIDLGLLQDSYEDLQREHSVLRTVFSRIDDKWYAVTQPQPLVKLEVTHLAGEARHDAALTRTLRDLAAQPFEPADSALLRGVLTVGKSNVHVLGLAAHEALVDDASMSKLMSWLAARYSRLLNPAPTIPSSRWLPVAVDRPQGVRNDT